MSEIQKAPLDPARIRTIPPEGFSWIDRRFVREGHLAGLYREAILLYFFLVSVSDAEGLSFYADPTVGKLLKIDARELTQARRTLIDAGLVLYEYPLYQVLALPARSTPRRCPPPPAPVPAPPQEEELLSLREFLTRVGTQPPQPREAP
jgi:hypothetical protein